MRHDVRPFNGANESFCGPREQGRYATEFYTTVKTAFCRLRSGLTNRSDVFTISIDVLGGIESPQVS